MPFDAGAVHWVLLVVVMALGVISILAIGLLLAAICMQTRQESWSYPEAAAGALFLISGVVFPLAVLPPVAQADRAADAADVVDRGRPAGAVPGRRVVGRRRRLALRPADRVIPSRTPATIVVALLATGAVATLAAVAVFRASDRRAKDRGLLDRTTGS